MCVVIFSVVSIVVVHLFSNCCSLSTLVRLLIDRNWLRKEVHRLINTKTYLFDWIEVHDRCLTHGRNSNCLTALLSSQPAKQCYSSAIFITNSIETKKRWNIDSNLNSVFVTIQRMPFKSHPINHRLDLNASLMRLSEFFCWPRYQIIFNWWLSIGWTRIPFESELRNRYSIDFKWFATAPNVRRESEQTCNLIYLSWFVIFAYALQQWYSPSLDTRGLWIAPLGTSSIALSFALSFNLYLSISPSLALFISRAD